MTDIYVRRIRTEMRMLGKHVQRTANDMRDDMDDIIVRLLPDYITYHTKSCLDTPLQLR